MFFLKYFCITMRNLKNSMYFYREDSKQEWQGKMFTIKLHTAFHGNMKKN